jgi:hypothetical protein
MSCGNPPECEDPIVAEVHRVRREIFARFNGDMDAYLRHIRAGEEEEEEEERKRGRRIISTPVGPSVTSEESQRKVG